MKQNIAMESQCVNNDKGNWCKRLRSRKDTTRHSSLKKADKTENNSVHQREQSDRKISAPWSPKKQPNQRATDIPKRPTTPPQEISSAVSGELKTSEEVHKASSPPAPSANASDTPQGGLSPQGQGVCEDVKHTIPQLTESLCAPRSLDGVFTCVRCNLYTKDIGTFLQHTHVRHEPQLFGDAKDTCASQSDDLNSYLSLTSTGHPLKYEFDSQKPQNDYLNHKAAVAVKEKERKYVWRKKHIQPKVEDDESAGLKLHLKKHPLKADSWMARGYLSLSGEGMLDENGLLLNPEETLEATNQYLQRTIGPEKSAMKTTVKEELQNLTRPVTPASLLLPKNATSLPPEAVNPSNNDLAVLMERNNISLPPNCTTEVQGFKMVDGKKHLVLKVMPAPKQEIVDAVEPTPCPTEGSLSSTRSEPQILNQSDPACSVKQPQACNGISAHEAISTYSPPFGKTDADRSPLEKPAHGPCEDQGFCDGPNQGCNDNRGLDQDVAEDSHKAGNSLQSSAQEVRKQPRAKKTLLMPMIAHAVSEGPSGLLHKADQPSMDEVNASVDVIDECLSPAAEGDSGSESDGGFPGPPSPPEPDTLPASPCWPRGDGKEHSHTDDGTSNMNIRESHVLENNADASEVSGIAESVKSLQGSTVSIQTTCPQNSETPRSVSSPDVPAEPITELRTVQPLACTQDAVEKPGSQELSPLRTETAVNKRPRDSSPNRCDERPASKVRRDVDYEDGTGSSSTETGCWEPSPRHVEKTLRLFPLSFFQLIKKPQGDQPVVVLNHPDAHIPEVANIMRVVHKYGNEVQKVVLCQQTLKALSDLEINRGASLLASVSIPPSPRRVQPGSTVKERFSLKLKLRRSGQNAYQVVNAGGHQSLRCWFCGRLFTKQEDFICHGQRHLMEATSDWSSWFKSQ
ncbi:zinc finger protein 518A [Sardina pilchardus]|uniref:zinc finger protein 518A n=1 Tax=Sardina pilchardus TaxID=27697 RepID=UPI002E103F03